ncbi:hypothetical protein EZV62_010039 [Acer yangbiense]|uniref:Uncharacterized protein n=1 Tax=Acer yangbiense TaxID=1000413 RepID=A0A5C7I1W7_9ROSI|nr:hypothetical protein EZV62_010039 [Acer yangbiense]
MYLSFYHSCLKNSKIYSYLVRCWLAIGHRMVGTWVGSESTPFPTFFPPGVSLETKKGAHLGLGDATIGMCSLARPGRDLTGGGAFRIPGYAGIGASSLCWEIQDDFELGILTMMMRHLWIGDLKLVVSPIQLIMYRALLIPEELQLKKGTHHLVLINHSGSLADKASRGVNTELYSTTHKDITEMQVPESDPCKAQLLEALHHSQTHAREAETEVKQAYAEKEHILKLFFRQASQPFAYKQWFQLLQLETPLSSDQEQ